MHWLMKMSPRETGIELLRCRGKANDLSFDHSGLVSLANAIHEMQLYRQCGAKQGLCLHCSDSFA